MRIHPQKAFRSKAGGNAMPILQWDRAGKERLTLSSPNFYLTTLATFETAEGTTLPLYKSQED
jgi:hypothetical protein